MAASGTRVAEATLWPNQAVFERWGRCKLKRDRVHVAPPFECASSKLF